MNWIAAIVLGLSLTAWAADHPAAHAAEDPAAHAAIDPEPHPQISPNAAWATTVIGVIGALFLAAIPIGILVRANMPEELPVTTSHDEPDVSHPHEHGVDHTH